MLANQDSSIEILGDETFYYQKISNDSVWGLQNQQKINRTTAVQFPTIDGVLLDDGYQHRQLKSSFQILLTPYQNHGLRLCFANWVKSAKGKNRADVVVVTKCPSNLSKIEQDEHTHQLNWTRINISFSRPLFMTPTSLAQVG